MKGRRRLTLPRLPRRWRIVRNAAATLLLLGALAAALDFPVLTQYGTFRRLEEQYLLAPARLVYRLDDPGSGAAFLTQEESWIAVGMVEEFDGTFLPHYSGVITQVLDSAEEHVVVLPMRGEESETAAAAWGMPEEAASAQLELILEGVEPSDPTVYFLVPRQETFTARAGRREDGWFVFTFPQHTQGHEDNVTCAMDALWRRELLSWNVGMEGVSYRLTLWDQVGNEVGRRSGTLPENQALRDW